MPPIKRKVDSQEIEAFLGDLEGKPWLKTGPRRWWPKFLFFFSDIRNIVNILESGKLLSRNEVARRKLPIVDCASREILGQTDPRLKDYVRLYFGPRTPTQYLNEGLRPVGERQLEAHCPVPIFLLFDSKSILTRSDCEYSNGNIASSAALRGSDAQFLKSLPFEKIYHRGVYDKTAGHDIIFHRHAEALIPDELDLKALRYILCRSPAEKETLVHLLPADVYQELAQIIFVEGKQNLFEKRWTFVERVELSPDRVVFHFSPDTRTPGPFEARLTVLDLESGDSGTESFPDFYAVKPRIKDFSRKRESYEVRLDLDGNPVYANRFVLADTPF